MVSASNRNRRVKAFLKQVGRFQPKPTRPTYLVGNSTIGRATLHDRMGEIGGRAFVEPNVIMISLSLSNQGNI